MAVINLNENDTPVSHIAVTSDIWPNDPMSEVYVLANKVLDDMIDHGFAEVLYRVNPNDRGLSLPEKGDSRVDWFIRAFADSKEFHFEIFVDGFLIKSETLNFPPKYFD